MLFARPSSLKQNHIINAFDRTDREYLKTIERRERGSQWIDGFIPWQVLAVLDWRQLGYAPGVHLEGFEYFQYSSPLTIGTQKIKLLSDFKNEELLAVDIAIGSHGNKELVTFLATGLIETGQATLILKLDDDNKNFVVASAYPGICTASLESVPEFDGTKESLVAVKNSGLPIAVKCI